MIIAFWTLPLTLIFLWLSFRVIRYRRAERIPIGSGGNAALERAIRAHANFAEFVPFAVLLLILAEWGAIGRIAQAVMRASARPKRPWLPRCP
ncbi:MAG: MAPEG family protein [Alphaproteobacteria bacterium]